jgi:hypothetical protein
METRQHRNPVPQAQSSDHQGEDVIVTLTTPDLLAVQEVLQGVEAQLPSGKRKRDRRVPVARGIERSRVLHLINVGVDRPVRERGTMSV